MIYSLITPSDPLSFHATDDAIARLAGLTIGRGKVGVDRADGTDVLPIFLLATPEQLGAYLEAPEHWGGGTCRALADTRSLEVADALDSIEIVRAEERAAFDAHVAALAPDLRAAYLEAHRDEERSSMSDWRAHGAKLAAEIRRRVEQQAPTGA